MGLKKIHNSGSKHRIITLAITYDELHYLIKTTFFCFENWSKLYHKFFNL